MAFQVQVRMSKELEQLLKEGKSIEHLLDDEIRHNSMVIRQILGYAHKVMPKFTALAEGEVKNISDAVAWSMRTDIVKRGSRECYFDFSVPGKKIKRVGHEDGYQVHLLNDPEQLSPEWQIPYEFCEKIMSACAEIGRNYCVAFENMKEAMEKIKEGDEGVFQVSWKLGDMTAYLLDPNDLIDYNYTDKEKKWFQEELQRDWESV